MHVEINSFYSFFANFFELDLNGSGAEPYNDEITETEFSEALRLCKDSAPGRDNISYIMIKKMDQSAKRFLLKIFNKIMSDGVFPEVWGESLLIPILKPGKPASSPNSYRPIALTSCICKLLENLYNALII